MKNCFARADSRSVYNNINLYVSYISASVCRCCTGGTQVHTLARGTTGNWNWKARRCACDSCCVTTRSVCTGVQVLHEKDIKRDTTHIHIYAHLLIFGK
jgi:hypothetical protein